MSIWRWILLSVMAGATSGCVTTKHYDWAVEVAFFGLMFMCDEIVQAVKAKEKP